MEKIASESVRVLIADDNDEMRNTVIKLLEPEYDVVGACADGRQFVAAAMELRPEVAILDISMPEMGGIDAAAEIKRLDPAIKIVFLSMHEDADYVAAAFAAGANGYVAKRQMATDLRPAITGSLNGHTFISSSCVFP